MKEVFELEHLRCRCADPRARSCADGSKEESVAKAMALVEYCNPRDVFYPYWATRQLVEASCSYPQFSRQLINRAVAHLQPDPSNLCARLDSNQEPADYESDALTD